MNNLTKEQLLNIIAASDEVLTALAGTNEELWRDDSTKMCAAWDHLNDHAAPPEVVKELAEFALAALTAGCVKVPDENMYDPDIDVFDAGFMNGWNACRAEVLRLNAIDNTPQQYEALAKDD